MPDMFDETLFIVAVYRLIDEIYYRLFPKAFDTWALHLSSVVWRPKSSLLSENFLG